MPLFGIGPDTGLVSFTKNYGGTASEFQQSDYITKLIGIGKMTDQLKGGVCQGLSAMWIASRGDWAVFKNIIQTPGGINHVRGFMNLQHCGIKVGSLAGREAVTDYLIEQVRIFGIAYLKEKEKGDVVNPAKIAQFTTSKSGFVYCNFYGHSGGHSVALCNTGLTYSFFDPNYGVAVFTNKGGFTNFLKDLFDAVYPSMNQHWWVLRFSSGSGKPAT